MDGRRKRERQARWCENHVTRFRSPALRCLCVTNRHDEFRIIQGRANPFYRGSILCVAVAFRWWLPTHGYALFCWKDGAWIYGKGLVVMYKSFFFYFLFFSKYEYTILSEKLMATRKIIWDNNCLPQTRILFRKYYSKLFPVKQWLKIGVFERLTLHLTRFDFLRLYFFQRYSPAFSKNKYRALENVYVERKRKEKQILGILISFTQL